MLKVILVKIVLLFVSLCWVTADQYSQKNDDALGKKLTQLIDWSSRRAVIKLNTEQFKAYVKSAPRNYSVVVMLTALSASRQCQVCKAASDEFSIVANSWRYTHLRNSKLFFAMVDFDDGFDIFRMLNQNTAPVFIHFPPKGSAKKADFMDVTHFGFAAEVISKWIQERTDIQIRVFRPPNYTGTMLLALFMSLGATVLYFKRNSLDFLKNRTSWGTISLVLIFGMMSGQMWNHIRGPPMMHANPQNGQLVYIYPSGDFQFVAETFIVLFLYVAISAGLLIMNEAGVITESGGKKKLFSLGGLALFVFFFSLIISIFRIKYQGYPYRLLF